MITVNESPTHPFERSGLGKAPFRFVGMIQQDLLYGQVILNREEYQRTGIAVTTKPGGSCDYCGTYIVNMYRIASSDGHTFKVGCECVNKTGDKKLSRDVSTARRAHDRHLRAQRKARAQSSAAASAVEVFATELATLDALAERGSHFAQGFARDVARRIRNGTTVKLSPRQRALLEKLAGELR